MNNYQAQYAVAMQSMMNPMGIQYMPMPMLPAGHVMHPQGHAIPHQPGWIYPSMAVPQTYSSGLVSNALSSFMQAAQQMSENGKGPNFNLTVIEQNAPSTHFSGDVGQVVDARGQQHILNDNRGQHILNDMSIHNNMTSIQNEQRTQIGQMVNGRAQSLVVDSQVPYQGPQMVRDLCGNIIDARTIYDMIQSRPDDTSSEVIFAKPARKPSIDLTSLVKTGKPYSPSRDSRRLYHRGNRESSSEEDENLWNPIGHSTPQRQKRRHNSILPSPEASPDGSYIGQHSQGLGGHYPDSYFKRPRM